VFPRCPLSQASSVLVAAATLTLLTAASGSPAPAAPLSLAARAGAAEADRAPPIPFPVLSGPEGAPARPGRPEAHGLRTDRLSAKQRERWRSLVRLVLAEDDLGRPLHPTLRRMWDEVAASTHEIHVELPGPNRSSHGMAGLFRVESVRPDGHIVAMVRLHLETIDQATVADSPSHGFRRFEGLGREGRYLEVLGHELGHAVWTLADPERARRALALRNEPRELARSLLQATPEERAEIRRQLSELGAQAEAQELPARAAEAQVWRELAVGPTAGVQAASSPQPESATGPSSLTARQTR
jgi:hypothetical protein